MSRFSTRSPLPGSGDSYRSNHIGHNEADQEDIANDEEKAEKSNHVRRKPHGQDLNEGIPLETHSKSSQR